MKKILFITHVGDPGGAEHVMIRLCEPVKDTSEILLFQNGTMEEILKDKGVDVSVCPMPDNMKSFKKKNGVIAALRAVPATLSMIRKVASKCKEFDVIVCMSQKSFVIASLAKPLMRKPIIWCMNDILSEDHFSKFLIKALVNISKYSANHVVLNSQASLDAWNNAGGKNNVTVMYPGSDVQGFDEQLQDQDAVASYKNKFSPDGSPLVGIFGRISPWKGQDVFLKSLARLENVRAVIVGGALFGEEDYEASLKELAKDLGIEDRVIFAGHVTDVAKVMASCDIVAHCSTSPEPFGLVIVEAMLSRIPVVATNAGGAKEIVLHGETGQLTPISDVAALSDAIDKYLNNPEWMINVVESARKRAVEEFSADIMNNKFAKIVNNVS
ncbi:MAG: glycosyltransferase family 4 protein [Alphaproteobacteria bacterium]